RRGVEEYGFDTKGEVRNRGSPQLRRNVDELGRGAVGTVDDGVSDDLYPAEVSEVSLGWILDAGFDHRETTRDLRVKVEAEAIEAPARWGVVHVVVDPDVPFHAAQLEPEGSTHRAAS